MADFVLNPYRLAPIGSLSVAPFAVGATTRPAQPGSMLYDAPGEYDLVVTGGMLPLRIEAYGSGGGGGGATAASPCAGGAGGGGYVSADFGGGIFTIGAAINIDVREGGSGGNKADGTSRSGSYVNDMGTSYVVAWGGEPGLKSGKGGYGGGADPGFPFLIHAGAVNVVTSNGEDGQDGNSTRAGAGGAGGGPLGGAGGTASKTAVGADGLPIGGGGGGAKLVAAAAQGGNGSPGWVRISWGNLD